MEVVLRSNEAMCDHLLMELVTFTLLGGGAHQYISTHEN